MRQSEIEQCHADTHRGRNTGQCHGKGISVVETSDREQRNDIEKGIPVQPHLGKRQ